MDDRKQLEEDIKKVTDTISKLEKTLDKDCHESYNEMLIDIYGDINVCGVDITAPDVLFKLDPQRYENSYDNYIKELESDLDIAKEDLVSFESELDELDDE